MTALDAATLRQACAQMADWPEGRRFGVTPRGWTSADEHPRTDAS